MTDYERSLLILALKEAIKSAYFLRNINKSRRMKESYYQLLDKLTKEVQK